MLGSRAFALALLPLAACSRGTDAPSLTQTAFSVVDASVDDSTAHRLTQPVLVEFSDDVDFSTVSPTTLRIVDEAGAPVLGSYSLEGPRTVRFQPVCPAGETTQAGLRSGSRYRLVVAGPSAAAVQSTAGERLRSALTVPFRTPDSTERSDLFHDPVDAAPSAVILGAEEPAPDASSRARYSYVEFGGDPEDVAFFRLNSTREQGELGAAVPLNFYSDPSQQFSILLAFDQPILDTAENVSEGLIALEFWHAGLGEWRDVPATVALESNCAANGAGSGAGSVAAVRITPLGVLPAETALRVAVRAGFEDLAGQATLSAQTSVAHFQTTSASPGAPAGQRTRGSDEILERFTVGGTMTGSLEDTGFPSPLPRANWGGGTVTASSGFTGTGGTGGDFDLLVRNGETIFLNTASDVITGGPGGAPTTSQAVIGGVIDVRNLTVEDGGRLIFVGPNPALVLASGEVRIAGDLRVDGSDNFGVGTLNTTNQPEQGAAGQGGGGRGGTGSFLTSESTPRGGAGFGAFDVPGLGGEGGETSYAPIGSCSTDNRRAAGGGGGAFGPSVRYWVDTDLLKPLAICQTLVGMDGEPGFTGSPDGTGAVSQSAPARGGALGPTPFMDASPNNDFFGTMIRPDGSQVRGELNQIWAGAGGGAGGDAVRSATFPLTPFSNTGDEKGSGGGGGAGGLGIFALGDIVIEPTGEVSADGGTGGGGENTIFFDRIGGGSGGGSGGHIVLSSAASIIIEADTTSTNPATGSFYRDSITALNHTKRPLRALGGQGGAGRQDRCGNAADGETRWRADGIPFAAFEGRSDVPPLITPLPNTFNWCNELSACAVGEVPEGTAIGAGGDGTPGLIQLHVSDPDTQLVFGPGAETGYVTAGLDVTRSMVPPPVGWTTPEDAPGTLVPFFGARSASFSRWIPLGLARLNPDGSPNPVEFAFEGTDDEGSVLRDGSAAQQLAPVLPYAGLSLGGGALSLEVATAILKVPGGSLADPNGLYQDNANLLREFAVRFRDSGTSDDEREFIVAAAAYDSITDEYSIALDAGGPRLSSDIAELDARAGDLEVEVVPFFFRLLSSGAADRFPAGTNVQITFDATIANAQGSAPSTDPEAAFSARVDIAGMGLDDKNGFTGRIAELNEPVAAPGQTNPGSLELEEVVWDFVRFRVEFDLGGAPTVDAELPGIDFLRVPYRF